MHTWKALGWAALAMALGALGALFLTPKKDAKLLSPASEAPRPGQDADADADAGTAPDDEAAVARLEAALEDPEDLREAIAGVARKGLTAAVPLLERVIGEREDAGLRAEVLRALEHIGGTAAVESLARIWSRAPGLRDQVEVRLSRVDDRGAAPALVAVIEEGGRRGSLAVAATRALGRTRLRRHVPLLGEIVDRGPDDELRAAAAEALGEVADPEAIGTLAAALDAGAEGLRRAAIGALGRIRSPRARSVLEDLLARDLPTGERVLVERAIAAQRGETRSPFR